MNSGYVSTIFLAYLISLRFTICSSQGTIYYGRDPCVDEVYQRFQLLLSSRYPQYANLTNSLPTSRNVYQSLFLQGFSPSAFYEYCAVYRRARTDFDSCPRTQYRDMVINGYGLADLICVHKIHEFSRHLPCLQNAHYFTLQTCNPRCYQFQGVIGQSPYPGGMIGFGQNPYTNSIGLGLHPSGMIGYGPGLYNPGGMVPLGPGAYNPGAMTNNGVNRQMAADCQYQRCLAECRHPLFEQQCGREASRLELEALYTTYASIRNIHEPPEFRRQYEKGYSDAGILSITFPAECYALAINSAVSAYTGISWIVIVLWSLALVRR